MCPDREILSAYLDGEVEAPWSGAIASHLEGCPSCRTQLARMEALRSRLLAAELPAHQEPMERVRRSLLAHDAAQTPRFLPFWRRSLSVPLPLAAGAAALVLLLAASLMVALVRSNVGTVRITKAPAGGTEIQISAPIGNIETLLKSLDNSSSSQEVITLPNNYPLVPVGQPLMGKETELLRNKTW